MQANGARLQQTNYTFSYNGASRVKLCRVAITIDYHAIAMSATGLDVRKGSPIAPTVKHVLTKNLIASVVLLW